MIEALNAVRPRIIPRRKVAVTDYEKVGLRRLPLDITRSSKDAPFRCYIGRKDCSGL